MIYHVYDSIVKTSKERKLLIEKHHGTSNMCDTYTQRTFKHLL